MLVRKSSYWLLTLVSALLLSAFVSTPGTSLGFSVNTAYVASTDGGLKPANVLSNPYPSGRVRPSGATGGLRTLLG
jgi:hypothetical protein